MKKSKKISAILMAVVLGVSLVGCGASSDNETTAAQESGDVEEIKETATALTSADADTSIIFSDNDVEIKGSGAAAEGAVVTITEAGKYAVSGTASSGQVLVDLEDEDDVTLIFDGADITNEEDAVIYIENAKSVGIILAAGSENRIQSGAEKEIDLSVKNQDSSDEDASGGAVRAKCDLTVSGEGILRVFGYINNGIQSSDNLTIDSGTIEVTAVNHGIKGSDSVNVSGGDITITALQDGIHSNGSASITGGNITIAVADDGIHADEDLTIEDGVINITESYEGIEGESILLAGGVINVMAADDGINATNGQSSGFGGMGGFGPGNFELPEGFDSSDVFESFQNGELPDDFELPDGNGFPGGFGGRGGMDRDNSEMPGGFGGRGGMDRDDSEMPGGFGGRGGMDRDNSEMPEGFGGRGDRNRDDMPDREMSGRGDDESGSGDAADNTLPFIRITGGEITVTAEGDGIDSNGDLYVEGGTVIVNGPTMGANGALDYGSENGGECLISGGTVIALGSSGMAETFGADSTQPSFLCNLDSTFNEGDLLTITAEDGTVLFEYEIKKKGSSVVFSSPDLNIGDTVTLTVGDESTGITLESVSTRTGGRGGFGDFGGMNPRDILQQIMNGEDVELPEGIELPGNVGERGGFGQDRQ